MSESHLTLEQAAERLGVSRQSIWYWCRKGVSIGNGERIRLDHGRLGRRIVIELDAIAIFSRKVAEADVASIGDKVEIKRGRRKTTTTSNVEAAEAELEEAGI